MYTCINSYIGSVRYILGKPLVVHNFSYSYDFSGLCEPFVVDRSWYLFLPILQNIIDGYGVHCAYNCNSSSLLNLDLSFFCNRRLALVTLPPQIQYVFTISSFVSFVNPIFLKIGLFGTEPKKLSKLNLWNKWD